MKLIGIAWLVHIAAICVFYVAWIGTFGSEPRWIPESLDIWLPLLDLTMAGSVTIVVSGIATFEALKENRIGTAIAGWVTSFVGCIWIFGAAAIMEWV